MEKNQFYPITYGVNIKSITAATKSENAYICIDLPAAVAAKMLKQIALDKNTPIKSLELCWYDEDLVGMEDES